MTAVERILGWWQAIQAGAKLVPPMDMRRVKVKRARATALGDTPAAHELLDQAARRETELRNGAA